MMSAGHCYVLLFVAVVYRWGLCIVILTVGQFYNII